MMSHFEKNKILADCQHGFRSKRSCETQLLSLTQELHQNLEDKEQVDMVVLDFSKAFDKVPHKRLMTKLRNYGIRGNTHKWIESFLVNRTQRVVVDGEASDWAEVQSGVPQGTVLGPILFLAFINDLPRSVKSHTRLFADDCVIYRSVKAEEDCISLQEDLAKLEQWENTWCMSFNPDKCSTISITRKKKRLDHSYTLHNQVLKKVDSATYLGVELASDLTWAKHINKTAMKANRQLAFLRRNIPIQNPKLKEMAYKGIVRPVLEYCAPVWDPYHKKYIRVLDMVQRRAARFTLGRYGNRSSVTDMLHLLQWESLEHRRKMARLTMFYKIQYAHVAIPLPPFVIRPERPRPGHPHQYQVPFCATDAYKNSFFPRTIRNWNALPSSVACQSSLPLFKAALSSHLF
jgi:ribonuclease P/MRP protein subunit RPP40